MCGPFSRDLRQAPAALLQQIQQQKHKQRVLEPPQQQEDAGVNFNFPFDASCAQTYEAPFGLPQEYPKDVGVQISSDTSADIFNWGLLDETFVDDFGSSALPAATAAGPAPASQQICPDPAAIDFSSISTSSKSMGDEPAQSEWGAVANSVYFDGLTSPLAPATSPEVGQVAPVPVKAEYDMASKCKGSQTLPKAQVKPQSSDSDSDDPEDKDDKATQPYSEKLPKELLDHPCAATLLSAGIRIKGRTREELLEVAERIKKRRRASAARCRARKATHVHHLEEENHELKSENMRLRQRIAELTGGTMDLNSLFGFDATAVCAAPTAPAMYAF